MEIFRNIKVLEVHDDYFIGAKGYKLCKYLFATKKYEYVGKVADFKYALASSFFLTRRLLRAEITHLYSLSNGDRIVIAKKGIFRCPKGETVFKKCFSVPRGSRPMNLVITPDDQIYFGEYFANMEKKPVNIYHSADGGITWRVAYTFTEGNINHIHGLFWDPYTKRIWIATGDRENECIIGNTDDGFKTLNIVLRGGQDYRATNLLFYRDFIIYATDSQYIVNEIRRINRDTLCIDVLNEIQGSAIKGGQNGEFSYISTTVEPSKVNKDCFSHLWISHNGVEWVDVFHAEKDILPALFQFGSIEFPHFFMKKMDFILCSGRAVKRIGGHTIKIKL